MDKDKDFVDYYNVRDYVETHYYDKVVAEYIQIVEENYCGDPFITDTAQDIMFKFEGAIKAELRYNGLLPVLIDKIFLRKIFSSTIITW